MAVNANTNNDRAQYFLSRAAGRELPALQMDIDALFGDRGVLPQVYAAGLYHSILHFTFHRIIVGTLDDVKSIYMWSSKSKVVVPSSRLNRFSTEQDSSNCPIHLCHRILIS